MDFKFSTEDVAFRDEVLDFLGEQLPPGWADLSEGPAEDGAANRERWEFTRGFHRALAERGWLTLGWPQEHGGAGAGPIRQAMFNETMAHHRAPVYNQGVDRVGPTVIMYGSDEQKDYFLPRIRNADISWCQGFSEPGSGSDLASLQTRAQRDGDDYIINGQKIWTSGAQHADWIFMLARTEPDAPKHRGISFFLVDMKTPCVRWSTWPTATTSTRSSSRTSECRPGTWSARKTEAGTWPQPRSTSSAPASRASSPASACWAS
ncbi:MAG: acyl-CoA dehydrogenase family protein [Chloroflexi bacterium]|nr:acyl-CoA dehydrogenase family protein [Chloroflexota bacterium]